MGKKLDYVAHEICKNIVAQLGHAISVKYLPSQIAAVSMHLAKKQLLREEMGPSGEIDKVSQYLEETMKILGCDHVMLADIFAEIEANSTLQEYLTGKRVRKVVEPREMVSPSKRRVRSSHIGHRDHIS